MTHRRNWLRLSAASAALAMGAVVGVPSAAALPLRDVQNQRDVHRQLRADEIADPFEEFWDEFAPDSNLDAVSGEDTDPTEIVAPEVEQVDTNWRALQSEDFANAQVGPIGLTGINNFWAQFGNPFFDITTDPDDVNNRVMLLGRRNSFDGLAGMPGVFEPGKTYRVEMRARLTDAAPTAAEVGFGLTAELGDGSQPTVGPGAATVRFTNLISADRWTTISGLLRFDSRAGEWRPFLYTADDAGFAGYEILVDDLAIYEFVGEGVPPTAPIIPGPVAPPVEPTDPPTTPAPSPTPTPTLPLPVLPPLPTLPDLDDDEDATEDIDEPAPVPSPTAPAPAPVVTTNPPMPGSPVPAQPDSAGSAVRWHPVPETDDEEEDTELEFHGDMLRRAEPEVPEVTTHTATYPEVDYAEELGGGISRAGLVATIISALSVAAGGGYVLWRKPWQAYSPRH